MKLLTKTALYYLATILFLFAVGGVLFYNSLTYLINDSFTEGIYNTKDQIEDYTKKNGALPPEFPIGSFRVQFAVTSAAVKEALDDTILPDQDNEPKPYRTLTFPLTAGGKLYAARITRPLVESDELIESIAYSLYILTGILLVVLLLLNWFLSKSLWKPFYKTMNALRNFDLSKKEALQLSPTRTAEFKALNLEIEKMTEKIQKDYRNLKEFTENASHEIQTPLAIIRSKLELMIQSENLSGEQMKFLQDIQESANRLSKLNQSLLLLAKIENRQFHDIQNIDVEKLMEGKLGQFAEMISFKNLSVEKRFSSSPAVRMNLQLADILVSNLIANAIKHNLSGGKITITLDENVLSVSNTGNSIQTPPEKLFERFQKASTSGESVGLGLSIVKQICDSYNFTVNYNHTKGIHTLSVRF